MSQSRKAKQADPKGGLELSSESKTQRALHESKHGKAEQSGLTSNDLLGVGEQFVHIGYAASRSSQISIADLTTSSNDHDAKVQEAACLEAVIHMALIRKICQTIPLVGNATLSTCLAQSALTDVASLREMWQLVVALDRDVHNFTPGHLRITYNFVGIEEATYVWAIDNQARKSDFETPVEWPVVARRQIALSTGICDMASAGEPLFCDLVASIAEGYNGTSNQPLSGAIVTPRAMPAPGEKGNHNNYKVIACDKAQTGTDGFQKDARSLAGQVERKNNLLIGVGSQFTNHPGPGYWPVELSLAKRDDTKSRKA
ncbi:uncharacterized protein KY384_008167 [Bacidia gigantensis]|uniref:uncharacterized protein n=1 Tax=Bacidia gigantensis TaxID=2732470 RepID=UPI001D053D5A|nr:uncharacterized protein KY384_008167 [Bacidia gigantensis]KAG8526738.1 hypothetical protein KY384_008167 [Bacidia gigantensis]